MSSSDEHVQNSQPAQKPPVTRACDLCRVMKVRCIPDLNKKGICQRCASTNRECIFKPIKTKRKKRTDTRVAELEREVQAMRVLLERGDGPITPESKCGNTTKSNVGSSTGTVTQTPNDCRSLEDINPVTDSFESLHPPISVPAPVTLPYATDEAFMCAEDAADELELSITATFFAQGLKDLDVIDREILSMETARTLFAMYNNDIAIFAPFVLIPDGITADDMRFAKPILFLAIIAAAAGKYDPHLYKILNSEMRQVYSSSLFAEKSLQLVQAMIVTAVWYFPPSSCRQVKYYEYIHMAATMALDIGIGTKPRKNGVGPSWEVNGAVITDHYVTTRPSSVEADLENRRTFISCYILCSEVALSTRRPSMLRFNNWIADCAEFLKINSQTPSDKHLIAWVRLLRLCEEITASFGYDSDVVSLSEPRVQLMLKSFEKRLEVWNRDLEPELRTDIVNMIFYKATLYLHELAIHDDHPPEDLKPPWHLEMIDPMKIRAEPTLAEIDAAMTCISSAHSIISAFLNMSSDCVRSIPTHTFFAGVVYSAVILMKLDISASDPASKLGQYIDRETLKVKWYLNAIASHLKTAVGTEGYRVPSSFLGLFMKFQRNYESKYTLWTGIANDDHQYDVMTGEIISTHIPSTAPVSSDNVLINGSTMSVDEAMAFDMQMNFDADLLGAYNGTNAFGNETSWVPMDFTNQGSTVQQTYNWA